MKTFIGVDYSMTSPGICFLEGNSCELVSFPETYNGKPVVTEGTYLIRVFENPGSDFKAKPITRYSRIAARIMSLINRHEEHYITIEGYSMGSRGAVFNIAENTAVLKYAYHMKYGTEIETASPTTIKKFATGKGNATKELMYESFVSATGLNLVDMLYYKDKKKKLGSPITDLVDSYWIAQYTRHTHETREKSKT